MLYYNLYLTFGKYFHMLVNWKLIFTHYFFTGNAEFNSVKSGKLSVFLCFLILGIISATGLLNKKVTSIAKDPVSLKLKYTQQLLKQFEKENLKLQSEILISNYQITRTLENRQQILLKKLSKFTGTYNTSGEGIIIRLSDNKNPLVNDENPNRGIIHDFDLIKIVNDLWSMDSKAISINEHRITSATEIKCIGPTILINKTRATSPFEIRAVGSINKIAEGMESGYLRSLKIDGINSFIEKYNNLKIPADKTIIMSGGV